MFATIMLRKEILENIIKEEGYLSMLISVIRDNGYQISRQFYTPQEMFQYVNDKIRDVVDIDVTCSFVENGNIYEIEIGSDEVAHVTVYKQHRLIYNSLLYYDEVFELIESRTIPSMA